MHEWNKTNWFLNWLVWVCAIDLHTAWSLLRKLHRFCTTFFVYDARVSPKHKSTQEDRLQLPVTAHLNMERVRKPLLKEWWALDQQIRDPWSNSMISQSQKMFLDNTESKIYSRVILRFHSFNANHSSWWSDHSHQFTSSAVFSYVEKLKNHLVSSRRCALILFGRIYYSRFFPCRSERINKLAVFN